MKGQKLINHRIFLLFIIFIVFSPFISSLGYSQQDKDTSTKSVSPRLTLAKAVMCGSIKDFKPWNEAVVFPLSIGKVSCFTYFDPVPEKTFIYHNWYHRDKLSKRMKLYLQPPSWSTFSSIQFRDADKGAWRVEITDSEENILNILRFSITE